MDPAPHSLTAPGLNRFMDRRGFVRTSVHAGAGALLLTSKSAIAQQTSPDRIIKCALVGCGAQGERLRNAAADVPGVQWVAVCDIWPYSRNSMVRKTAYSNKMRQYPTAVAGYADVGEMLAKQTDIDAVFIATPDFLHAPFTRQCLKAGKAVYCESIMSNTLEGARDMVKAQQETGGILQIGHQRRSNPRYQHLRERIYGGSRLLGHVPSAYGQWNRSAQFSRPLLSPKNQEIPVNLLEGCGYESMGAFLNWRTSKKYCSGIFSELGSQQIDLFNWVFDSKPTSVFASGGIDYHNGTEGRSKFEHPDNVMAIYEYQLPSGTVRLSYQVLLTTGSQGYYEKFMGVNGSAVISENPAFNHLYSEPNTTWESHATGPNPAIMVMNDDGQQNKRPQPQNRSGIDPPAKDIELIEKSLASVGESLAPVRWGLPVALSRFPHSPHIQNFIECTRAGTPDKLTCPAQSGYETCVSVLAALKSLELRVPVNLTPQDFVV